MCIDFRMLNKKTKIDVYPIPQTDEILDYLCKARIYSKIDFSKAYHQAVIEPLHMHKTAFFKKYILFKFLVPPFRFERFCTPL